MKRSIPCPEKVEKIDKSSILRITVLPTIGHGILAAFLEVGLLNIPLGEGKILVFGHVDKAHHLHLFTLIARHKYHLLQAEHLSDNLCGIQFFAGAQIDAYTLCLPDRLMLQNLPAEGAERKITQSNIKVKYSYRTFAVTDCDCFTMLSGVTQLRICFIRFLIATFRLFWMVAAMSNS